LVEAKVAGIAVHTRVRVAAQAAPGAMLVSSNGQRSGRGLRLRFQNAANKS
jgi:hypothetical protein